MDLIEAGVETKPHIDASEQGTPKFDRVAETVSGRLQLLGEGYNKETEAAVVNKLIELHKYDSLLALTIIDGINRLNWYSVSKELIQVWLPEPIVTGRYFQIAVRRDLNIRISREHFLRLDPANRAALIFHETLYAMAPLNQYLKENEITFYRQEGLKVRDLVGILFSVRIKIYDIEKKASENLGNRYSPWAAISRIKDDQIEYIKGVYLKRYDVPYSGSCSPSQTNFEYSPYISKSTDPIELANKLCQNWTRNDRYCKESIYVRGLQMWQVDKEYWARDKKENNFLSKSIASVQAESSFGVSSESANVVESKEDCMKVVAELTVEAKNYMKKYPSIFD